jgi:hypothetical protein
MPLRLIERALSSEQKDDNIKILNGKNVRSDLKETE